MEKFNLDDYMVESIEYMREQDGLSFYGIINAICAENSNSDLFSGHATKILRYFNGFDEREDDENFLKCFLGHYSIKSITKDEVIQRLTEAGIKVVQGDKLPNNGSFSGIIGSSKGVLTINLQ